MTNYVIINGVNSNTINGLGINELPPITKPQMRVQNEEIDGRDGDITTNLGYSAYDKTITIGLFGTGYDINDIVAFFNGEGTIVFSNEADKYYNFKIINQIDYVALQKFKSATITFHCQPFKYPLTETPLEIEYSYIEDEGETLTLNDTAESTLELTLKGNTSQTGTPTPDAPIDVNVVSGDNEVVVCGKNLIPFTNQDFTLNSVRYYSQNGKLYLNGTSSSETSANNSNFKNNFAFTLEAGTYTFKKNIVGSRNQSYFFISINKYDDDERLTRVNDTTSEATFTLTQTTKVYLGFYVYQQVFNAETFGLQLEKSATPTTYEPYNGDTYEIDLGVKNEFNVNATHTDMSGVTYKYEYTLKPNTQYTISSNVPNSTTANVYANGTSSSTNKVCLNNPKTITSDSNGYFYIAVRYTPVQSDSGTINMYQAILDGTYYLQIEEGEVAHSYSEYGIEPIKMRGIGTYEDYFVRNSGKNLFDKNNANILNANLNNDKITSSNPEKVFWIECKPNTTYTIQKLVNSPFSRLTIADTPTEPQYGDSVYNLDGDAVATSLVHTTGANAKYMVCWFYNTSSTNYTMQEVLDSIMINEGSIALPYEPYGTGQWCKYNAIGEAVLDGSETWTSGSTSDNNMVFSSTITDNLFIPSENNKSLCNNFTYNANIWNTDNLVGFALLNVSYSLRFRLEKSRLSDTTTQTNAINSFKSWLSTHNTIVYYVLATPYLSLIEDETLISQLDKIEKALGKDGQTNINQVNNDLPFVISTKALEQGSNEVVVNNIGNIYAKPLIALEGSGNVNIYLDNTQILQANVEDKMNIDIAKLEAYNPDTSALLNRQVIGNYNTMTLQPGESTIRIDGALDKATISNYTRWL